MWEVRCSNDRLLPGLLRISKLPMSEGQEAMPFLPQFLNRKDILRMPQTPPFPSYPDRPNAWKGGMTSQEGVVHHFLVPAAFGSLQGGLKSEADMDATKKVRSVAKKAQNLYWKQKEIEKDVKTRQAFLPHPLFLLGQRLYIDRLYCKMSRQWILYPRK